MIKQYAFMSCEKNSFYDGSLVWSRDRIIIPIFDRDGKLTSWQGRALDPESEVKYLFSPDFKKSQHLYNSWNIKKDPSYLIVSEGVFDTLGWIKNGFTNTVASFGKKISKMQVELIRLINPTFLFLALDYDCVFEMISFIEEYGHLFGNCRVIKLPVGRDSDECSKLELLQSFKSAKAPTWADKVLSRA